MAADPSHAAKRANLYRKFWRRSVAGIYHSPESQAPRVDVYGFLPSWKPWAPAHPYYVYITGGVSDAPMPGATPGAQFARIELSAYAISAPGFGDPQQDEIAKWLHAFARLPFQENLPINPGDTFDVGRPLAPGSEMTAFYFSFPPFVDKAALYRATLNAQVVAHMVPISEAERSLAEREGSIALVEAFGRGAVPPAYDLQRRSCV